MSTFKLPLSGDVVQSINPWTAFLSPIGSQFGLININLGQSSEPSVEQDALSDVGSYGKQLGRIGDALIVLIAHFHPDTPLSRNETNAVEALKEMLNGIADVKEKHSRAALRRVAAESFQALAPPLIRSARRTDPPSRLLRRFSSPASAMRSGMCSSRRPPSGLARS
jgi:hypothetical protein